MNIKNMSFIAAIASFAISSTSATENPARKNQVFISYINNLVYLTEIGGDKKVQYYIPNHSQPLIFIVNNDGSVTKQSLKKISQAMKKNSKRPNKLVDYSFVDFNNGNNSFLTKCNGFAIVEMENKRNYNLCNEIAEGYKNIIAKEQQTETEKQQE